MNTSTGWNAGPAVSETADGKSSMGRLRDFVVLLSVALAIACSGYVLGQVQRAAAPPPPAPPQMKITVKAQPAAKKANAPALGVLKIQAEMRKEAVKGAVVEKRAVAKGAVRVRRAVAMPAPPAAQLDAQVEQFIQQFRPLFRAEYYFLRRICDLAPDQRKQVAREGERAVHDAAKNFAELQQKMMQGGWRPGTQYPEPQQVLEDVLSKSVTGLLSPAQRARYKEEIDKRIANRKQVALDNMVAKLDSDLVLTALQREKISESLSSHWNDSWSQSIQMLMNIEHFFPNIPDNLVVPFLTENQRKSWQRIPRNQNVFFGFNFGGMQVENDPLDDPELVEARQEAEAREKQKEHQAAAKGDARRKDGP
jgi:hypothetical protein